MSRQKRLFRATPVAMAVMLSACGGGSGSPDGGNADTDQSQAVSQEGNGTPAPAAANPVSVSGRVADGYIRGATVCIDLNENTACDADEPSAITGDGGLYDLIVPAGAEDKPIVADIPAEAIDEDTGDAVGKPLVFIAPPDRPEFVSPMTTLVHHELTANPSLDVAQAEQSVKAVLGISEDDISLFDDYVAESTDESSSHERAERFRYLHDTARVIASMMKDIETQVESAAGATGMDVAGDRETRQAIRDIVRTEVRELLPEIAREVAEIVDGTTDNVGGATPGTAQAPAFDPDRIAQALRPAEVTESVHERIDAVKNRTEASPSNLKQAFTDGVYWLEFDCHDVYPEYPVSDTTQTLDDQSEADEGAAMDWMVEEACQARYGVARLDASGTEILTEDHLFDPDTGGWIVEQDHEVYPSDYTLIDGEWVMLDERGPAGQVSFDQDGAALITNPSGAMRLKAVSLPLDARSVTDHLWEYGDDAELFDLGDENDLFSAGALAHKVSVEQQFQSVLMFNHAAHDENDPACSEYAGNCNVVNLWYQGQTHVPQRLDEIREMAQTGVELMVGVGVGADILITLETDASADAGDTGLPEKGTVQWFTQPPAGEDYRVFDEIDLAEADQDTGIEQGTWLVGHAPEGECDVLADEQSQPFVVFPDTDYPTQIGPDGLPLDPLPAYPDCMDLAAQTGQVIDQDSDKPSDGELQGEHDVQPSLPELSSDWRIVEEQGQLMLEIDLPLRLRHEAASGEQALLLIENEGVVRFGARLSDAPVKHVMTYNETAFTLLKSLVERQAQR